MKLELSNNCCSIACIVRPYGLPGSSLVKNPPAMQKMEMWVLMPGVQEDPLEEGHGNAHSSILVLEIQRTEEPGRL